MHSTNPIYNGYCNAISMHRIISTRNAARHSRLWHNKKIKMTWDITRRTRPRASPQHLETSYLAPLLSAQASRRSMQPDDATYARAWKAEGRKQASTRRHAPTPVQPQRPHRITHAQESAPRGLGPFAMPPPPLRARARCPPKVNSAPRAHAHVHLRGRAGGSLSRVRQRSQPFPRPDSLDSLDHPMTKAMVA